MYSPELSKRFKDETHSIPSLNTSSEFVKWVDGSMDGGGMSREQTDRRIRSSYPYMKLSPGLAIQWLCCVTPAMSPNLSELPSCK